MGRRIITTQLQANISASTNIDGYFDRLIKYIPSEIVGAWVAVTGLIKGNASFPESLFWLLFIIFLALTALYIWRQTSEPNLPPAFKQTLASTGAFAVWVFALGEPFSSLAFYQPIYGSILLILYNLMLPLINV